MINETILDLCLMEANKYSMECLYKNLCPTINTYFHSTIKIFIILGFILFIVSLLINRFSKYIPLQYFKSKENRQDLEIQIFSIYSFSCIILFVIMLTFGL